MVQETKITFQKVINKDYLKKVWKKIKANLPEELIRDPIDHLAYEANLEGNLGYLIYRIKHDKYTPTFATIIRAAKRDGMTRPLALLEIEDQIVFNSISEALEEELLRDFPDYVNFSRKNVKATPIGEYETWFDKWLRHQTLTTKFIVSEENESEFVVESDIANFFPSINLELLKQLVLTRTKVEEVVINLLFHLINSITPKKHYVSYNNMGLPQENFGASRILAHAFLKSLDDAFIEYGQKNQYVRWMDDIKIGVKDHDEGKKCISKIQVTLEQIGLNINSAKTKIITREQAKQELFIEFNSFLDEVHENTKNNKGDLAKFDEELAKFLKEDRIGGWERVLRRFYTESRRIGSKILEEFAWEHIREFPASSSHILKYLEGRPYSQKIEEGLWEYLASTSNIYEDVEIRIFEFLLRWRIPRDRKGEVVNKALDYFFSRKEFSGFPLMEDYTRALISLLVFKLGGYDELLEIKKYFLHSSENHFIRYAYVIFMATEEFREDARKKAIVHEDLVLRRIASFLEEVIRNPTKHQNLLKKYITPKRLKLPDRYFLDARALPLIRIMKTNKDYRSEWNKKIDEIIKILKKTPEEWRDEVIIEWLEHERHRT
ncbi:RNA-directed DNA polymerase [Thermoanaerobacter pentosaceus]|uniref:Reverse transcriptase domain-containing protein n=1 Tax=Thermoanaerobacter pentosaceus TaxID=694059 RepID=A0ABT9M5Q6_9THEO|nr:RNA-directed DNA polymerase [Thermoanaerobacter pentosaceus]MDP9751431.1 hypothetical protein [Thermoanaerobacter pentosaceus]